MNITVILPAYNEESYLPATLDSIQAASTILSANTTARVQIIVVDNNSTDATASVAIRKSARVVHEPEQGISKARNTGARYAAGDVLVFIDADVIVPPALLEEIYTAMSNPVCVGGGVAVDYQPKRLSMRLYPRAWKLLGQLLRMVQGATRFCRKSMFETIGGYDETAWIDEDVDFYWALKRLAKERNGSIRLINHPTVQPSSRRFDEWPVWKTLVWTNPLFIAFFRRLKRAWGGWYSRPVR